MQKIEEAVRELIARDAKHKRKKVRIQGVLWSNIIDHLYEEVDELDDSVQNWNELLPEEKKRGILEELGDLLGLLAHATVKAGFTMKQVEEQELLKLKERFE